LSKNHFYRFANWTLHCWANFLLSSLACQGYWCQHDIASTLWSNKGFSTSSVGGNKFVQ
jgi:hypothetical protein